MKVTPVKIFEVNERDVDSERVPSPAFIAFYFQYAKRLTQQHKGMALKNTMEGTALIVVDVQNDFLPGGSLAVEEGDHIIEVVNKLPWKTERIRRSGQCTVCKTRTVQTLPRQCTSRHIRRSCTKA